MASIYQNLFKSNPNRELYLKVELIDGLEPEWINTSSPPINILYGATLSNQVAILLPPSFSGYALNSIQAGDIVKSYPISNDVENTILNLYSFPITEITYTDGPIPFDGYDVTGIITGLVINTSQINIDDIIAATDLTTLTYPTLKAERIYTIKKEIFGKILSGGINVDADNSSRRTLNFGFSVDALNENANIKVTDFQNKRIKVYIGLKNLLNEDFTTIENNGLPPDSNNIVWFKMGVYNVTDISMEHSVDSIAINMTAQDKSALIDGNASGTFGESPATVYFNQETAVSYYDMLVDFLTTYSNQQENKIIINFGDYEFSNYFSSVPSYNSGTTISLPYQRYNNTAITAAGSSSFAGFTAPSTMSIYSNFYWDTATAYTTSSGITLYYPIKITSVTGNTLTISGYTSIYSSGVTSGNIWRELKPMQYNGTDRYYQDIPLQFNANDTVLTAAQKISSDLTDDLNFYFDVNGDFIFERKKLTADINSYVDPLVTLKPNSYSTSVALKDTNLSDLFSDSILINSYSYNTRFSSLKNDLSCFGLGGVLYTPGTTDAYDTLGTSSFVQQNGEVLYHSLITNLPTDIRNYGFSLGYGVTGITYGYPYQQFIIDKTNSDPQTNVNLGLSILKDYQAELKARFEFIPIPGIVEWSSGFSTLAVGNTVYIGKTKNYYSITSGFNLLDWTDPINNFPTHTAGTLKGLKFLGIYNPYYGIYRKVLSTDPGATAIVHGGKTFYYVTSTTTSISGLPSGTTTFHYGIYRSRNTGNPSLDFGVTKPFGNYASWLYWFDILDEKINFWSNSVGYTNGTYIFYNDKTYRSLGSIAPGFTNPANLSLIDNTRSLKFDGSGDYVNTGITSIGGANLHAITGEAWTVEGWYYPGSTGVAKNIISKYDPTAGLGSATFHLRQSGAGVILTYLKGTNTTLGTIGDATIPLNQWNHFALTWNGTNAYAYINGGATINLGVGIAAEQTNSTIMFGGLTSSTTLSIDGYLSDIRIWNSARSQNQIQANKNWRLTGNETGLKGYWRLNETVGSTIAVSSANSNSASVVGATFTSLSPFSGSAVGWTVARQGYGLYDISIDKQGVKKIRFENENINTAFKKNIDPYTNTNQILLLNSNIAYDVENFNSRLYTLLSYLDSQGITTTYIMLYDSGLSNAATEPFNKVLPVDATQKIDAFNTMKQLMYQYTTLEDNVSINNVPIYAFDVDYKINIQDAQLNKNDDYYIRSMSIPFDGSSLMSIEGIKITPLFIGSGLNDPSTIEVQTFTTTASPSVSSKKYFITDSQNGTLNIFSSTNALPDNQIQMSSSMNDILDTTYFKDSLGFSKLFILSSNLYCSIYNIDYDSIQLIDLQNLTGYLRSQYNSSDIYFDGTIFYILLSPKITENSVKIVKINKDTLTVTGTDSISSIDMPITLGNITAFLKSATNYLIYTYTNSNKLYTFEAGSSCTLTSVADIGNFYPIISGFKSSNRAKLQSGASVTSIENAYYLLTDNNIIRVKNIENSFSGITYSFGSFPGLTAGSTTTGANTALSTALSKYRAFTAGNNFTGFFTTVALTQMAANSLHIPFTTTYNYPLGAAVKYSFNTNSFGTYGITAIVYGITTGNTSGSTFALFAEGSGITVGTLFGSGLTIPAKYLQPIYTGVTTYSEVVKDTAASAGLFSGAQNMHIHPTDGIYVVAGSNIYLIDYYLNNNTAQLIFT